MKQFLIILAVGLTVYANSLFNDFIWEDWGQLVQNPVVQNVANIPSFFLGGTYFNSTETTLEGNLYRPVMLVYFSLISSIFGVNPFIFHLAQVIIHIINSFLVFIFLKKFIKEKSAFWMSLIFLVHPINVEAVSYISIANDPLYFLFGLLGLIFLDKRILLSGLLFLFSIFAKESGILFLFLGILYSFIFLKGAFIKILTINILILIFYLLIRVQVAHIGFGGGGFFPMERLPLEQRLLAVPSIIMFYLLTFLLPINLSIARQWNITTASFNQFFLPLLSLIAGTGWLVLLGKKMFQTTKQKKAFLFFGIWLIISLGFYMQIFPLNMTVAERWFYLTEVGLLGLLGLIVDRNVGQQLPKYILIFFISIVILLGLRAAMRNYDWRNDKTLFSHDITVNPNSYMIQIGMGVVQLQEGNYNEAEINFKRSIELFPYEQTAYLNLASVYEQQKDFKKAEFYFEQSLRLYPNLFAYERLSTLKTLSADWEQAEKLTQEALKYYPNHPKLHLNMALIYYKNKNFENAIFEIQKGYELSKDNMYLDILKKFQNRENININY